MDQNFEEKLSAFSCV